MKKQELLSRHELVARLFLFLLLGMVTVAGVFLVGPSLGLALPLTGATAGVTTLRARMPEAGGWSQDTLTAVSGQPLRLRLTSDDVMHSFAIGQSAGSLSAAAPVDIPAGEWVETTLVFDQPGRYTFYCTRWCGPNHWRMRGTILVTGSESPAPTAAEKPLYLRLGLDIDAPHPAEDKPATPPLHQGEPPAPLSSEGGAALAARLPAWALARQTYLENSPAAVWKRLRADPALKDLSDSDLWNAVAYLWARQTSAQALSEAEKLYATNCAACHGETGKGDGVEVAGLPRYVPGEHHASATGGMESMTRAAPPDLTDPSAMLGASPALLQGKLLRGGMGTGMPNWGAILTPAQLDAVTAYLYTFALGR